MISYIAPKYRETAFNCPHCGAYSNQDWCYFSYRLNGLNDFSNLLVAFCTHCGEYSLWHKGKMIYPCNGNAPLPNSDLPVEIKDDYEEARSIISLSPRGSAALLRLAIQKLCKHLGEDEGNINTDIANLVKKGLPPKVQKSLDIVRVVGNNAVHPGQIDLKDDNETAEKLFGLVNLIAEVMITQPKHVEDLYNKTIPQSQKEAIEKRDGKI
ncbi:MAG: DUF4145 domain-containing protein [Candidatus Omnitrophica bacterium]|nr:DUF4145 domain-containing protein [Candidatus Omnitrophota bacterium]